MLAPSTNRSVFWTEHFAKLAQSQPERNEQIDFSNQAIVVQNYAYVLEACGAIAGKNVLDAGFGTGELARILELLGGRVSAIDAVGNRIPHLREVAPAVAWSKADLSEWELPKTADRYELIVACESLQYVEFNSAIARLLKALTRDGRLVVLIPNSDCPIVQRVTRRFDNQYIGISMSSIQSQLSSYLSEWSISYRGIAFQDDQTLVPYRSQPWQVISNSPANTSHSQNSSARQIRHDSHAAKQTAKTPPNRLQIVFSRPAQGSDHADSA